MKWILPQVLCIIRKHKTYLCMQRVLLKILFKANINLTLNDDFFSSEKKLCIWQIIVAKVCAEIQTFFIWKNDYNFQLVETLICL